MRKGVDPLVSSTLLIASVVAISIMLISFSNGLQTDVSGKIVNTTKEQINCQYAELYINNATYNCSASCAAGITHTVSTELANSGKVPLHVSHIVITNTTGSVFTFTIPQTSLAPGTFQNVTNTTTESCASLNGSIENIRVLSDICPNTASDLITGADIKYISC